MSARAAIEAFLFREARLMDEMDYSGWLALWDKDGIYRVPIGAGRDPGKVSIINDDYPRIEQRIARLRSGSVLAVEGARGAMRRVVSNIEILRAGEGELEVGSNFILGVARTEEQQLWIGRSVHTLRRAGEDFRIARKTVFLINSERELPLLQFII